MKCKDCGGILEPDDGYRGVGRCHKWYCKMYNIPVKIKNVI